MEIVVNSEALSSFLAQFLSQEPPNLGPFNFDGLVLLGKAEMLQKAVFRLKKKLQADSYQGSPNMFASRNDRQLHAELSLLVDGLLMDYRVFESFGYENLYKHRYLTYEVWKAFQSFRTLDIIDELENAFSPLTDDFDVIPLPDLKSCSWKRQCPTQPRPSDYRRD